MKNIFRNMYSLMDTAGGNDGGGSGGSLLTSGAGGGGNNATQGGQSSGNQTNSQNTSPGNGNTSSSPQGNPPQDWRSSLSAELRDDPSLKIIHDINGLAKSYINAQKMVGMDKITIPSKHATDDDWKVVYEKLGLPKELKDYEVKMKEGVGIDKDFVEKFKTAAHKSGILPKQAQALADWFTEVNSQSAAEIEKVQKQQKEDGLKALKAEWGEAYEQKINDAAQVIREMGLPKELITFLDSSGFGDNPNVLKLFASVKEKFMKEGNHIEPGPGGLPPKLTPNDALKEANRILSDFSHPYHIKEHANHKAAVAEVQALFEMAHPTHKK